MKAAVCVSVCFEAYSLLYFRQLLISFHFMYFIILLTYFYYYNLGRIKTINVARMFFSYSIYCNYYLHILQLFFVLGFCFVLFASFSLFLSFLAVVGWGIVLLYSMRNFVAGICSYTASYLETPFHFLLIFTTEPIQIS